MMPLFSSQHTFKLELKEIIESFDILTYRLYTQYWPTDSKQSSIIYVNYKLQWVYIKNIIIKNLLRLLYFDKTKKKRISICIYMHWLMMSFEYLIWPSNIKVKKLQLYSIKKIFDKKMYEMIYKWIIISNVPSQKNKKG